MKKYTIGLSHHFDAAHFLRNYSGKCQNMHGHTWTVDIEIYGSELDGCGMLLDFSNVKKLLADELDKYDHKIINEAETFCKINPTAENLAEEVYKNLKKSMPDKISLKSVKVWESPRAWAKFEEQ